MPNGEMEMSFIEALAELHGSDQRDEKEQPDIQGEIEEPVPEQ